MNKPPVITATLHVKLKPFQAPRFARRVDLDETSEASAVPVGDLDDDALEAMALAWLEELYTKAGRRCPFYAPAKAEPR